MGELVRNFINKDTIIELGKRIKPNYIKFDTGGFEKTINPILSKLGINERIYLVANTLKEFLPKNFEKAAKILVSSLGPELDHKSDDPVATNLSSNNGFVVVALCEYISKNGKDHFDVSMKALYEMTKRFSAEGPIREFIINDEKKTLKLYDKWANDPNVHIRRLVSESIRPRLPWTQQLPQFINNPKPVIKFLNQLKDDAHIYVRRSVANNLNDISKDNPQVVLETLSKWKKNNNPKMEWLIKHALRTLIKKGNPKALALLGVSNEFSVKVEQFSLKKKKIKFGDNQEIRLKISSKKPKEQKLIIDYIVYHMKANGKLKPKVFKWSKNVISKNKPLQLEKRHAFKQISTRKYYSGKHEIHLQINGKIMGKSEFILVL